jgi:hypothetical protein
MIDIKFIKTAAAHFAVHFPGNRAAMSIYHDATHPSSLIIEVLK